MTLPGNPPNFRPMFAANARPPAAQPRRIWVPAEHEAWVRKLDSPGFNPAEIKTYREFRGDMLVGAGGAPQLLLIRARDWNTMPSRVITAVEKATPSRVLIVRSLGDSVAAADSASLW